MAAKKHPSGFGNNSGPGGRKEPDKPAALVTRAEKIEAFLFEWGRITVPIVVFGTLGLLYLLGVLDKVGLGYGIGLSILLAPPIAVAFIVLRGYFPAWARITTIVVTALYLAGSIWPFTNMVYPGVPEFSRDLTREQGEQKLPRDIRGGYYWVEVFGKSFSDVAGVRNERGRYLVNLNGGKIAGEFSDQPISGNMGTFDGMMVSQRKAMRFDPGPMTLRAVRVDSAIGPTVTVSGFWMPVPPTIFFAILAIALMWAVFVDSWFRNQTWRWQLAPWVGISLVFLAFFYWTWEPARMPTTAVWSGVIGGIGGFLAGWLMTVIGRAIIGKLRTKI